MNLHDQIAIKDDVRRFLSRNYRADIERLNSKLGNKGTGAGLKQSMPPVPTAGNPYALRSGKCIALIGLNPRWHDNTDTAAYRDCVDIRDCVDALRDGDIAQADRYHDLRKVYFDDDSVIYYGTYFTRLGRLIGEKQLHLDIAPKLDRAKFAKQIFRDYIFKADFVPWFSTNTGAIDWNKVADSRDDALVEYHRLLMSFLIALKPCWIQCNGKGARKVAENLFRTALQERSVQLESGKDFRFFYGTAQTDGLKGTPILMHSFGRFQGPDHFAALASYTDEWVSSLLLGRGSRFGE
jgi:hypothetical protein